MEINEYRPNQVSLPRIASEYEASQVKPQSIKTSGQEERTRQLISNEGNPPTTDLIQKALDASGLSASERNITIVQELLNFQMPVDKNTILHLIRLTATCPDVEPATLVLMLKNNLPINLSSIAQFEAYQRGTHQILSQLKSLIDHIYTQLNAFSSDTIASPDAAMYTGSDTAISHNNLQAGYGLPDSDKPGAYTSGHTVSSSISLGNDIIDSFGNIGSGNDKLNIGLGNNGSDNISMGDDSSYIIGIGNDSLSNISFRNDNLVSNIGDNSIINDRVINLLMELLTLISDKESSPESLAPNTALKVILPESELKALYDELLPRINEGSLYSNESIKNISSGLSDGSMTLKDLLSIMYDISSKKSPGHFMENITPPIHLFEAFITISPNLPAEDNKKLLHMLKSDDLRNLLTEALHQRWTLSPKDLPKENRVKEFYRRLDQDMEQLNKLSDSFKMSSDVKLSINKLQDNLQFMKDLNELFIYLQLPIRLMEQDTHGDLYVFTRKNHRHRDNENLNILLHLDMANLGPVDIHLSMLNSQVNAVFYLNKSSEQIIAGYLHELTDTLNDKGYQLQVKTQISDSKPDFINDILQHDAPSSNPHRYSFDIRA